MSWQSQSPEDCGGANEFPPGCSFSRSPTFVSLVFRICAKFTVKQQQFNLTTVGEHAPKTHSGYDLFATYPERFPISVTLSGFWTALGP